MVLYFQSGLGLPRIAEAKRNKARVLNLMRTGSSSIRMLGLLLFIFPCSRTQMSKALIQTRRHFFPPGTLFIRHRRSTRLLPSHVPTSPPAETKRRVRSELYMREKRPKDLRLWKKRRFTDGKGSFESMETNFNENNYRDLQMDVCKTHQRR